MGAFRRLIEKVVSARQRAGKERAATAEPAAEAAAQKRAKIEAATRKMFEAVRENDPDKLRRQIGDGAQTDQTNEEGMTALILAVFRDQPECVRILAPVSPTGHGAEGISPLMFAAINFRGECARILIPHSEINDADATLLRTLGKQMGLGQNAAELVSRQRSLNLAKEESARLRASVAASSRELAATEPEGNSQSPKVSGDGAASSRTRPSSRL
jgi:hypothetical protein